MDIQNHSYLKKLTDLSKEKLIENLENKFKILDFKSKKLV